MTNGTLRRLLVALALAASALATASCAPAASPRADRALPAVEVREYKGEKLGSVSDFRENSIKGPQDVDRTTYRLSVGGAVAAPRSYSYGDVVTKETTYTKVVTLSCVEGWSVKVLVEGVLISDLVDRAGPQAGANTVVFRAADGYSTSLPLDYVRDRRILLAYRMNGVELPRERGFPFQVIAEDRWGYKWCRWVTDIELSKDAGFRGYWEQRGYSPRGLLSNDPFAP